MALFKGLGGKATAAGVGFAMLVAAHSAAADEVSDAKGLVESFYTNLIAENYPPMINMFMPAATAVYTTQYGYGIPDDVFNFTAQEVKEYADMEIPEEYLEYFKGYEELGRDFEILDAKKTGDSVTVTGRVTEDYKLETYKGQNIQTDTFVIKFPYEQPLIASYSGVATFK
ncbi:hypothetical protein [Phaeobacter sp. NW0010-22]|uniref:hypothetical protein n=1 Tax=Phaeobacter sp. NW0010-22 TaxID=3135907 RepID=UPI0031029A00